VVIPGAIAVSSGPPLTRASNGQMVPTYGLGGRHVRGGFVLGL
jgi:hypothetical protein